MKPTIRNKLVAGFCGMMLLMTAVAGIGAYAVFSLRRSAQEATRIGGQLNSISLEIQVHNLEAQRRIKSYLETTATQEARKQYLEEAGFEIHEIETLATRAVAISPSDEKRAKFQKVIQGVALYEQALHGVTGSEKQAVSEAAVAAYDAAAEHLHENAEDGEVEGKNSSLASQRDIQKISARSVMLVMVVSGMGLLLGVFMSYKLTHTILDPVEHLKSVAENVSLGNLEMAVRRYSNDEIGDLADSFSRMVTAVKFFRMDAEMAHAESVDKQQPEA